ncbi:MAG: hypothetical protein AB7F89_00295 [Pirellulaceae bacterium]
MTLLELIIASTMLAAVMAAVSVVMRTSRQAWEAHEADYQRVEAAHATLRHIVRHVRRAVEVVDISDSADASGQLSIVLSDGTVHVWDHDDGSSCVNYGEDSASDLLASEITGLRFTGYAANGVTATAVPEQIRALLVEVDVQLPVEAGGQRNIKSWVWLRSW